MKRLILALLLLSTVAAISEKPYCYAGSDYYVIKYQGYLPELIALYDNTEIFFDINDDGVWEYRKTINSLDPYYPKTSWELNDFSRIHSNKPIIYNQKISQTISSNGNSYHYECVPPINSLSNEILVMDVFQPDSWNIITKNSTINIIDKNLILTTEKNNMYKNINTNSGGKTGVWYINSTNPIIALTPNAFSSLLDYDFIHGGTKFARVVALYGNTAIDFDKNGDGIFDDTIILNRGYEDYTLTPGTRIKSNKKIGVFDFNWFRDIDLTQSVPTKSINNELFVKIYEDKKTYITGLFNDDDGFENTTYNLIGYENSDSGSVASNSNRFIEGFAGVVRIKANKPVTSHYRSEYLTSWFRYQNNMQTIEPYVSSFSKVKFISINDSAIINIRVHNPTSYKLDEVKIKVRFLDIFGGNIDYYFGMKNLEDDTDVIATYKNTIVPYSFGGLKEFEVFIGTLNQGEYANIDYYLTTPLNTGKFILPPVNLEFKSEIWTIN